MSNLLIKENIEKSIFIIKGKSVMLDNDLALLYGVTTKRLNEQVRRNVKRFPKDFMFRLNETEVENLRSQNATSNHGGRRYFPYAFTEQGVSMLSSILNSERAIQVNIQIMRTFTKIRKAMWTNRKLSQKLTELETKIGKHDEEIQTIFQAIRQLTTTPENPKKDRICS